jgi:hypothetical protein
MQGSWRDRRSTARLDALAVGRGADRQLMILESVRSLFARHADRAGMAGMPKAQHKLLGPFGTRDRSAYGVSLCSASSKIGTLLGAILVS